MNTDQWRYEKEFTDYHTVPKHQPPDTLAKGHTMDIQSRAVRSGWLPFYPQFNKNPLEIVKEARAAGDDDDAKVVKRVVDELKSVDLQFSVDVPTRE